MHVKDERTDISQAGTTTIGDEIVMTYEEAAKFLGVSERTLVRYVQEARIPYVELPSRGTWRLVRFLRSQLLAWLEERTVKPKSVGGRPRKARDNGSEREEA
jgi:excisionase family DNA binding protein